MKKRDWPEEIDWIRKQDHMLYKLINILSVAAMLLLVCVVAYSATAAGSGAAMAAGSGAVSEDGVPLEVIRLTTSGNQITEADEAAQDMLQQALADSDEAMRNALEQEEQEEEESEYANLAIAQVSNYVNVREEPNTESAIVGKIYDGAVAEIQDVAGEEDDWFKIISGSVEGYIKAEFFIYGDEAAGAAQDYVTQYAVVAVDRLNVRGQPDITSERIGYLARGEKALLLEDCGEWLKVQYAESKQGYIAAEYVTIDEEFVYAKSIAEEQAELAAQRAQQERERESQQDRPEILTDLTPPDVTYTSNEELRRSIVEYAMQFLGNRYVHGGSSLAGGTDCSGFTSLLYKEYGYSLSRTPAGQYSSAGRSISYSEIQPGDIICYSSNGGASCTHVALYIGDGQIIHEANSRKGVIIADATYGNIIGIKNVID